MSDATVLLASGSPQRKAVLEELDIAYEAVSMDVDEVTLDTPEATVRANAELKAAAALAKAAPGQFVVAADTVVFAEGRILGKPHDAVTAKQYLRLLSGRAVSACTGVSVVRQGIGGWTGVEVAVARIRPFSENEIDWYVSTSEPLTRAGALGISHYGEMFVSGIEGSYSCFAGLPKRTLLAALIRSGFSLPFGAAAESLLHNIRLSEFKHS